MLLLKLVGYQYQQNKELTTFSRINRKKQTDAEKLLWYRLKGKQLAGFKFRRQCPIGSYILDFYCAEKKIAVELDGSQHMQSSVYDDQRKIYLQNYGIQIVRFWDNDVLKNIEGVLSQILEYVTV